MKNKTFARKKPIIEQEKHIGDMWYGETIL